MATAIFISSCSPNSEDAQADNSDPLTLDEMTRHLLGWRETVADRRGAVWLQKTPVDAALQRLEFLIAERLEILNKATHKKEGDARRDDLIAATATHLNDWSHRLKHFEEELQKASPIVEAFNVVRAAVEMLTFLDDAGVDVHTVHAAVRESANLHREARKLWLDQLRLILEGQEPDPLLIEAGLATARRAAKDAKPIQRQLSRIKTTIIQRQNLVTRTAQRIKWADDFLNSLDSKNAFHPQGSRTLKVTQKSYAELCTRSDQLDKEALNASREFEKSVRNHRKVFAALLHDLNAAFLPAAQKEGWPLPR